MKRTWAASTTFGTLEAWSAIVWNAAGAKWGAWVEPPIARVAAGGTAPRPAPVYPVAGLPLYNGTWHLTDDGLHHRSGRDRGWVSEWRRLRRCSVPSSSA